MTKSLVLLVFIFGASSAIWYRGLVQTVRGLGMEKALLEEIKEKVAQ